MGGNTEAEKHQATRDERFKKLLGDVDSILTKSIENRDAFSGLPQTKAQAIQGYVRGHKDKVSALINIYTAVDQYAALEREKNANPWLKGATLMDLARYTTEVVKNSLEAAVNVEAARVAASNPSYAKALAATSEKIIRGFGAPLSALEAISEAIRAVDALQRGDKEAYARSAGRSISGAVQFALFVTHRGFAGAATGAATAGAGVTFVLCLYVEGIIAFGQLGGILKQIKIEKQRKGLENIVERAYVVAGLTRSMFANHDAFQELLANSSEEAMFALEACEAEGRRLAAHLGSLTSRLEADSKLSREKFPKALSARMWNASIPGTINMTNQKQLLQEALYGTAAYVALRLRELELIAQSAVTNQMFHLRNEWRL